MKKEEYQIGMEWIIDTAKHVLDYELQSIQVSFSRIAKATRPLQAKAEFGYIAEKLGSMETEFRIIKNKYNEFFRS